MLTDHALYSFCITKLQFHSSFYRTGSASPQLNFWLIVLLSDMLNYENFDVVSQSTENTKQLICDVIHTKQQKC